MSCSFVQMSSVEVKKLAESILSRIKAHKEQIVNDWINEERRRHEKSRFRRLFGMSVPSDDELRKQFYVDCYRAIEVNLYAWRQHQVAEHLLKAATHADVIHVSVEDLDYIT